MRAVKSANVVPDIDSAHRRRRSGADVAPLTVKFSGENERRLRLELGLSVEEVAVGINRSASTVLLYERGRVTPPGNVIAALSNVLRCRVGDLFVEATPAAS